MVLAESTEDRSPSALFLRVLKEDDFRDHVLPRTGDVVLGSALEADIRIDDPSITSRHVRLTLGTRLWIEDLGSSSGTHLGRRRLGPRERVEIASGEAFHLGGVMVVVQTRAMQIRPKRLWTHGYFEARLEEECARAIGSGGDLALLRIRLGDRTQQTDALAIAATRLGTLDVVAEYAPGEFEILLVDLEPVRAESLAREIAFALGERGIEAERTIAHLGRDGRSGDALFAATHFGHAARAPIDALVVQDRAMIELYQTVDRIAPRNTSVVLRGEAGVGKKVIAEEIHRRSERAKQPFVRIDCGRGELDLERLTDAHRGTLFLDDVDTLSLPLQAQLITFFEERFGASHDLHDVRIIAATERDLEDAVTRRQLRSDLYRNLNAMTLVIPPLRERRAELSALARAFVSTAASGLGIEPPRISSEAERALHRYAWPGNLCELRNAMERAVLIAGESQIRLKHLPAEKMQTILQRASSSVPRPAQGGIEVAALDDALEAVEKKTILEALERCAGNQTKAAKLLGITRGKLLLRLEKYNLPRPRKIR